MRPTDRENLGVEILSSEINIYQPYLLTELRSPLESKIIDQFKEHFFAQFLPTLPVFPFSSMIQIPSDCESKLILANISLYGTLTQGGKVILLGSHSFIITADITELLAMTLPKPSTPDLLSDDNSPAIEEETSKPEPPVSLGLELFNLAKTPKLAHFHLLKPSATKSLPPRVERVVGTDGISPELPKLPRMGKHGTAGNSGITESSRYSGTVKMPGKITPINLEKLVIKQVKTSFPYLKRLKPAPEQELETQDHLPKSIETQLSTQENILELLPNHEQESGTELKPETVPQFPTLETQELITTEITAKTPEPSPLIKKWMKNQGYLLDEGIELVYQNNDHDFDESNQESPLTLNRENPPIEEELPVNLDLDLNLNIENLADLPENPPVETIEPTPQPEPLSNISSWLSQEIVLDDTYVILGNEDSNQPFELQEEPQLDVSPPLLTSLAIPQLFLPNGELVAGSSIKVRLELSKASSTVVVKLWVEDYQTRGLLDGPHLLQDLRPTPWGNWEAITQLIVPLGCVEILVGAIALDVDTQQESHKVTFVKTVIPPDLPMMELDEVLGM
ncbi:MAG: hypothetical protein EAZ77_10680 [Nostocales cyanobacterium]|nr:MAG: hypothetical protein EAZ77_10680 [Nostocales cyanobacterium]